MIRTRERSSIFGRNVKKRFVKTAAKIFQLLAIFMSARTITSISPCSLWRFEMMCNKNRLQFCKVLYIFVKRLF